MFPSFCRTYCIWPPTYSIFQGRISSSGPEFRINYTWRMIHQSHSKAHFIFVTTHYLLCALITNKERQSNVYAKRFNNRFRVNVHSRKLEFQPNFLKLKHQWSFGGLAKFLSDVNLETCNVIRSYSDKPNFMLQQWILRKATLCEGGWSEIFCLNIGSI